jgi:hypothetical protein
VRESPGTFFPSKSALCRTKPETSLPAEASQRRRETNRVLLRGNECKREVAKMLPKNAFTISQIGLVNGGNGIIYST